MKVDMTGSSFCAHGLEKHPFEGKDYLCSNCGRSRALHVDDAFIPGNVSVVRISRAHDARFRSQPRHTFAIIRPVVSTKLTPTFRDPKVREAIRKAV